jgi:hypothetical protein
MHRPGGHRAPCRGSRSPAGHSRRPSEGRTSRGAPSRRVNDNPVSQDDRSWGLGVPSTCSPRVHRCHCEGIAAAFACQPSIVRAPWQAPEQGIIVGKGASYAFGVSRRLGSLRTESNNARLGRRSVLSPADGAATDHGRRSCRINPPRRHDVVPRAYRSEGSFDTPDRARASKDPSF